ncbi:flagellar basal body P-ring protein FlgI [Desulfohalobiaceae bacterium Ax17]|jgi:flagellar P-ring protein precursor FlgI|nr:flagellar basal body P-ring protein FlgI [Desulfovulcanus ferrireducens]MBT8763787.1 flagellar basal body P-ring protein FlgI [Desulfovulcanus ferrireducens]
MRKLILFFLIAGLYLLGVCKQGQAVRLKDIATFGGVRTNQLVGYGLVVGLSGTGDKSGTQFTIQSLVNMLENMGVRVDKNALKVKNVAAVMVTARMPVSAKPGTKLDVTVSSIGDAKSLLGGVLLQTPLKGIDGKIYALAQGPLVVGGFSAGGAAATATKNITTVARIPGGAMVERAVPFKFNRQENVIINLSTQDFSTTAQIVDKINNSFNRDVAKAEDISTVRVKVPERFRGNLIPFLASLENLDISPDSPAKIVVDEKTGTVVMGENVTISKVAIAHGNLHIVVQEQPQVSQPAPFSQGQTQAVPRTQLGIKEEQRNLVFVKGATIKELVDGLNAIGASPRDLISILRSLKAAGALHAQLEVI